jgi:hypothetical protein
MNRAAQQPPAPVPVLLPADVVRTPSGRPAVLVVRTARGWTVLAADAESATEWIETSGGSCEGGGTISLVEAMSLADLVATELGVTPEPGREARRAARASETPADTPSADPRDEEIAGLRRTVAQLEHALATRVSIERANGVLAERHGTTPREAFEELRRCARSEGRPVHELAAEVLGGLPARSAAPGQRSGCGPGTPGPTVLPSPGPHPAGVSSARRVQRTPRRAGGDTVPGARS